jgi:hypothetical protein
VNDVTGAAAQKEQVDPSENNTYLQSAATHRR